jgi:hypothetical protein
MVLYRKEANGLLLYHSRMGNTTIVKFDEINLSGRKMWTQSAVQTISPEKLASCVTFSQDRACFHKEVFSTETNNPKSRAYLIGGEKREVISTKMELVSSSTTNTSLKCIGSFEDYQPISYAYSNNLECVLSDYHEAAIAYSLKVPFYFLLKLEQIQLLKKRGEKEFRSGFFKKINNLIK